MKRRALLSHLQEQGCIPVREGASHSIWSNPKTGRKETIPRHNDIKKQLAHSICRHLSVTVPLGD
jgi:predicted RNA binding protein YcfA (HicA-like mRNA interferase family)